MVKKLNLGFLCSHGGSNMQAIINNVKAKKLLAEICVIVSNNPNSGAIQRAQNEKIPHYVINEKTNFSENTKNLNKNINENIDKVQQEIIRVFKLHNVDTVVLAGYMKLVSPALIDAFNGRILNIHPALLPKFAGKGMFGINVHRAVIAAKETVSGATIHLVNSEYDKGRILAQEEVTVTENDSPETLAERVLQAEHILFSATLIKISNGEIII